MMRLVSQMRISSPTFQISIVLQEGWKSNHHLWLSLYCFTNKKFCFLNLFSFYLDGYYMVENFYTYIKYKTLNMENVL